MNRNRRLDASPPISGLDRLLVQVTWNDLQLLVKKIIEEAFPDLGQVQIAGGKEHDYLNFLLLAGSYDVYIIGPNDRCSVKVDTRASLTKPHYERALLIRNIVVGLLKGLVDLQLK